ncbi:hypothetical protein [Tenacibaculum sp.]|uniref:hypothetical protein n=1 Tax=Tenacibaculum sp. TaxID=1906242 RepID=UPI003D0A6358
MKRKASKSEILVAEKNKEYNFDDASLKYASMTEEEAKNHKANLRNKIKELEGDLASGVDPVKVHQLREMKSTLAWFKANKLRSKYFRLDTAGASMRRAKRHPETNSFNKNDNTGSKRVSKKRRKRKTVQVSRSLFSRIFGSKSEN